MLDQLSLTELKGVGEKMQIRLAKLGLDKVQDLLFHLPYRYQDKTKITPLNEAIPGTEVQIEGTIINQQLIRGRRQFLIVNISDATGERCQLTFFNFYPNQARSFVIGKTVRAFGELKEGRNGLEIIHPDFKVFNQEVEPLTKTLTPIYPTTEGLGQKTLLNLIHQALQLLTHYPLEEGLPKEIINQEKLLPINDAILTLHQPSPDINLTALKNFQHPAQKRLILEEFITQQLSLQKHRKAQNKRNSPNFKASHSVNELLVSLPFKLTNAQTRVWQEIQQDLTNSTKETPTHSSTTPMQRLVQGDVGSGKTIIAALAALQAADNGYQVAIMAPTEILAEQHKTNFLEWLAPLNVPVAWLNGRLKSAEKREMLQKISSGTAKVIVGTHALFQEGVIFHQLGLIIIDEQHRFGVEQRLQLSQKANSSTQQKDPNFAPHQLTLTATPIPRTLAMSAYGDLDISVIDQLPPGRKPIETAVISNQKRYQIMQNLDKNCQEGSQAYWVCQFIAESEVLDVQAAETTYNEFTQLYPQLRVGLIHGKMKSADKDQTMQLFKDHQLDLLVATTVIEVGVNIPNASIMIIENAERLGLAQLHQLRGRVGRGNKQSHCVLLYQSPLSETARARLKIMRETNDGFIIAEEDLKLRGAGEILGTRQTGGISFKIADIQRDFHLIETARNLAKTLIQELDTTQQTHLENRWIGKKIDYKNA